MNMDDIELRLLAGMSVPIEGCGDLYAPTVKEVIEIGENRYNQLLSLLLFDKNNLQEKIDDDLTNFDIVFSYCYHNEEFRNEFLIALKFIFKKEAQLCDVNASTEAFFIFIDGGKLQRDNFSVVQEIVRIGNHVKIAKKEEDEYNPADEITAKVIAEMLERRKKKPKPKPIINLHSIISGLAWKSGSPQLEAITNLTMYQLYDGFKRMEKLDSIHYTLFGIYTGNVDAKKINVSDLNFVKILDN